MHGGVAARNQSLSQTHECARTLEYAASVSWIVLSYSLREAILRARLSLMRASRSVRMRRSFWILAASTAAAAQAPCVTCTIGQAAPILVRVLLYEFHSIPHMHDRHHDQPLPPPAHASALQFLYEAYLSPPHPSRSTCSPPPASRANPLCLSKTKRSGERFRLTNKVVSIQVRRAAAVPTYNSAPRAALAVWRGGRGF